MNKPQKYALLSVLGIVIASLLLSGVISNVSAQSRLGVSTSVAKNPISRGSVESITVKVTSNGKTIANADISDVVTYKSGFTKSFSGKTDSSGLWIFSWQIDDNSDAGTFSVVVTASKAGFNSGKASTSFTVITASGMSKKRH